MDTGLVALIGIEVVFVAFILWLIVHYRQKRHDRRAEDRLRLVEKFESGESFSEFLVSEGGKELMAHLQPRKSLPTSLWIVSLYAGILALSLGSGFLVLFLLEAWEDAEIFLVPAVLCLSSGFGLLLAARSVSGLVRRSTDAS